MAVGTQKTITERSGSVATPSRMRSASHTVIWRANFTRRQSGNKTAEEKFKQLSEAYEILSDGEEAEDLRPVRFYSDNLPPAAMDRGQARGAPVRRLRAWTFPDSTFLTWMNRRAKTAARRRFWRRISRIFSQIFSRGEREVASEERKKARTLNTGCTWVSGMPSAARRFVLRSRARMPVGLAMAPARSRPGNYLRTVRAPAKPRSRWYMRFAMACRNAREPANSGGLVPNAMGRRNPQFETLTVRIPAGADTARGCGFPAKATREFTAARRRSLYHYGSRSAPGFERKATTFISSCRHHHRSGAGSEDRGPTIDG